MGAITDHQASDKAWATLQARIIYATGHVAELIELDDGRPALIVTKGARTRCLQSLAKAEAWLEQMTARG